jgi:hypothetical protein
VNGCDRPLDWRDIEALGAGGQPPVAADAAEHARGCPACRVAVETEAALVQELGRIAGGPRSEDLSDRVVRLRGFTRRERLSPSVWGVPWLFCVSIFAAGVFIVAPALAPGEQAGLLLAAAGSAGAILRAALRTLADLATSAPAGLDALSTAMRGDRTVALAALAMLLPVGLGLRRALARAAR